VEGELGSLNRQESMVAPWKICDETKDNVDSDHDTVDGIIKLAQAASCKQCDRMSL
jgi:hypothetical protein